MWRPSTGEGKTYRSSEFRGTWCSDALRQVDGPRRHMFDCNMAAAAAAYAPGPRMSGSTTQEIASLMATRNNCHSYSGVRANGTDSRAMNAVLQSRYTGERAVLSSHEAAHIREGAHWLAANRHDLPPGFVRGAMSLYENVYDTSGRRVVDRRMFNGI